MKKTIFVCAVLLLCPGVFSQSKPKTLTLNYQTRNVETGETIFTPAELTPEKTAIIVIDMWNAHWCMTASERVSAMVPRMNEVLAVARALGMQVIWNPSDVITAYSGYPQYERAVAVAQRPTPEIRTTPPTKFTARVGHCMCGPGISCIGNYGHDSMNPDLIIADQDLFSASTDEIYTLLADRGITDIIYMGVHTNMCVYGKPGGLSEMWKAGFNCALARDLNDAFTHYNPEKAYTPDDGTTEIDGNLQLAGIPNVNMGEEFRRAGLWKSDRPADYVRFVPWGKPDRPYFTENETTVTLTAPWLEDCEIRYTVDGSEPTPKSSLYTSPLTVSQTLSIRATAFRKGKPVSLPSHSCYVKMPTPVPPQPDVYLDDLEYIPNAYSKRVSNFMWMPKKWKSYEGKPLRVRGKTYAHGMGFRAPTSVQYELKPEYKRFVARVGVDDNMLIDNMNGRSIAIHSTVIFKVFIDGTLAGESPVMHISQEPWRFDIAIPSGSRRVNLVCADAGTRNILDYGNWVDAGFVVAK
ncbi:MAG: NPCBM/NEW2 domain-containing protein [Tannerella sp.]|nr:NPCBM/NEW2 domain-containing protein [Tannerella sp.]